MLCSMYWKTRWYHILQLAARILCSLPSIAHIGLILTKAVLTGDSLLPWLEGQISYYQLRAVVGQHVVGRETELPLDSVSFCLSRRHICLEMH